MSETIPNIIEITPAIKNYSWGLSESECWVAKYCSKEQAQPPFAEAWFGAHPSGPATAQIGDKTIGLDKLVSAHQSQVLGINEIPLFDGKVPILPKVLSIGKPLSIQLHPSKQDAIRLHKKQPKNYPDPFPKDEASIALGDVELLHSLLSFDEILKNSKEHIELSRVISNSYWKEADAAYQIGNGPKACAIIFEGLLRANEVLVRAESQSLYKRLEEKQLSATLPAPEEWILKLQPLYPDGDKGIFCFLIFNLLKLGAGEAISLHTGTPHAYLSGELLEIMKPSDNVIRCGLTEKFIDIEELIQCLDLDPPKAEIIGSISNSKKQGVSSYAFAAQGFSVDIIQDAADSSKKIDNRIHIGLSLGARGDLAEIESGEALKIAENSSFIICANTKQISISIEKGKFALFSYKS